MLDARQLNLLWRGLLKLRVVWPITKFRCAGSRPSRTWISTSDGSGYFRYGVQRRYCVRFAGHRGFCWGMIDADGNETSRGSKFTSEGPQ
jgi:hypothetical protein